MIEVNIRLRELDDKFNIIDECGYIFAMSEREIKLSRAKVFQEYMKMATMELEKYIDPLAWVMEEGK